ncbi:hypothetical protein CYMTET_5254 [Cymbomonas tetramitiformis]|uniref:Uncharacterized protein n=1 Tax=Cymbomonas tetramitiformis TaxID=36881 RepID=A0AAE0GZT6_9CHLO|nr:hypothetical protein CYMTET_5254 [Cymbomonas tetramitiformis]
MARNLAHHQPLPASFRRLVDDLEANPTAQVTDIARVVVRGRPNPASGDPEGSSFMLVPFGDWTEEDQEENYQSLSTAINAPPGATAATVPTA